MQATKVTMGAAPLLYTGNNASDKGNNGSCAIAVYREQYKRQR